MSVRRRIVLTFFSTCSLVLGTGMFATGLMPVASASASAQPAAVTKVTICLTNSSSFCADVKNDSNTSGQTVWLYSSSKAKSYHWERYAVQCPLQLPGSLNCLAFQDDQTTNLCMGDNGAKNIVLMSCSAAEAAWVLNANNHLRNASWGPQGDLTVASNKSTEPLYSTYPGSGWQQWNGI